ncbi:glucokinase [Planktothrix sp. FACHB-1365]|uniref:glucokinase n=1 Tax=Planktothrix sp. FACHB-1365 TaxID=2692855 RepID=UPI0016855304|nr:glucokinase [Planktothrix sp. FACHB-1365]MBD2485274.1 glucokinase [Planktothrix sp. FACHB-1365]
MTLLLAGDIGGTKTILRLVDATTTVESTTIQERLKTLYEVRYLSGDYPDLVPIVQLFLQATSQQLGDIPQPERACFAIAGPVVNQTAKLTNLPWRLDARNLTKELAISHVTLINDFEAVGYGVTGLPKSDVLTLQKGQPQAGSPMGVIGAGTGLGQCFVIPLTNGIKVYPCEDGHTDFAPRSELEFQLMKYLLAKHNIDRVSVERVVSGPGIVAIYQFLRDRNLAKDAPWRVSTEIAEIVKEWEHQMGLEDVTVDPAAAISQAALEQRDSLSEKTMQMFVEAYGAEAGNLALKLLPYNGLYIAGGIATKILPLLETPEFMDAFSNKGRMKPILAKVPVHIVLNSQVGLIGAAVCAAIL